MLGEPWAVDGRTLDCAVVHEVSLGRAVTLAGSARERMAESNTWYVANAGTDVIRSKWAWLVGGEAPTDAAQAVRSFVEGHCAGVGEPLSPAEVRALLLVRANALAGGWSGVRPQLADRLVAFLENDWQPVVPRQGSVGAAGCTALAHVARVVLGLGGDVVVEGAIRPAVEVTAALGPIEATEKEALSLINGSSLTTALAALAVARGERVLAAAEAACALSMEAIRADLHALDARAAASRNHPGIETTTARLRAMTEGSELVTSKRRPDSFSVRCAPTVLGTARTALDHVTSIVEGELNGVADNPVVLSDEVVEGGHFHGAPTALAMDYLKAALAQVAGISERRVFRLTYGALSGLPSFLVEGSGLNSGLMLAQYTAASLVSEAKMLSFPGSIDTLPTVQHQEDHVPMGPSAARAALEVVERVADVVAIELLCATQAMEFRLAADPPTRPGPGTRRIYEEVRSHVPPMVDDRVLHPDLAALGAAVRAGRFVTQP